MPALETALVGAVSRGEMSAVFQPQFDLPSGRIVGAEALCRWASPGLGDIAPVDFIPVAEDAGLIDEIGRFMAERCVMALGEWPIDIAVNVSPYQLTTSLFTEWLAEALAAGAGIGGALIVEITESRELADVAGVLARLAPLRALGVVVSLDDYGTGHASLDQLERLQGTEVKLDRSLVADASAAAAARISEVVEVAHRQGIRVVAEGIETQDELDRARRLGCDRAQGFLLARPMGREELTHLLANA